MYALLKRMPIFNIYNLFNWPGLFQQTAEQYVLGILETTRQDLLLLRKRHRKLLCELTNGMYYSKKICEGGFLKHVHLIARSIKMLYGAAQYVRPYGQTSHKHTQEFHRWFLMIFLLQTRETQEICRLSHSSDRYGLFGQFLLHYGAS